MIEADGRDHADEGVQQIRGVEPAAEADFDNLEICADSREVDPCHRSHDLEIADLASFTAFAYANNVGPEFIDEIGESVFGDWFEADANALPGGVEAGRGVETDGVAGGGEDAGDHGGERPMVGV